MTRFARFYLHALRAGVDPDVAVRYACAKTAHDLLRSFGASR